MLPKVRAVRVNSLDKQAQEHQAIWSEEVQYEFMPEGTVGSGFAIAVRGMDFPQELEVATVPPEVKTPEERAVSAGNGDNVRRDERESSGDSEGERERKEYHWYDQLPGDPLYLGEDPEDLLQVGSLLEDLDNMRLSKIRVIREQEACLRYEVSKGEGGPTKEWLCRAYGELGELEAQMASLQAEQSQTLGLSTVRMLPSLASLKGRDPQSPEPEVLHTHAVPLSEVYADIESWRPSLLDEFNSIVTTHRAMRPIGRPELRDLEKEGKQVQYVPGKLVATVKAGTAAKKARTVACGNFLNKERPPGSPTLSKSDIFAGALDSLGLRAQLAASAVSSWKGAVLDVKTAFLTAPLQTKRNHRIVVLRPPKVLVAAGIIEEGSLFLIEKALYGLQESPQDWCVERDRRFSILRWSGPNGHQRCLIQSQADSSIWLVKERKPNNPDNGDSNLSDEVLGLLGVYVDDLLITAREAELEELVSVISKEWRCSPVQWVKDGVTFCGLEIAVEDGIYSLHQSKYIAELRQRHPDIKPVATLPQFRFEDPMEGEPRLEHIREAQRYLGELTWVSCRSRPDVAFSVSKASRLVSRNPQFAIKSAKHILAYLFSTVDYKLQYGVPNAHPELEGELPFKRSPGLVEAFSDASFGCEDEKSQSGIVVLLGGCMVGWLSVPQPFTTLSTCEAELISSCEALTLSQAVIPLWREMMNMPIKWIAVTDSVSAAAILLYPSGSWRTRHLRLRCRAFQEYVEQEMLILAHVKGQFQVADLLTKALAPPRVRQLLEYLDVKLDSPNGTPARGSKSLEEKGTSSMTKSLMVLACLVNPAKAQPIGGAEEIVTPWLWLFLAVGLLCCYVAGFALGEARLRWKKARVEGLRDAAVAAVQEYEPEPAGSQSIGMEIKGPPATPPVKGIPSKAPTVCPPPVKKATQGNPSQPIGPMPVKRPPPFMLNVASPPERRLSREYPISARGNKTRVTTPPRAKAKELPPLLSYEELIARSMRRELNREPTGAEVAWEISRMRMRHAVQGSSEGSSSLDSDLVTTDSEGSNQEGPGSADRDPQASSSNLHPSAGSSRGPQGSSVSVGVEGGMEQGGQAKASSFQYLQPSPTPVIRILDSQEDSQGNVVYDAVRVGGPNVVTVDLSSRGQQGSSSSSRPQMSGYYGDDMLPVAEVGTAGSGGANVSLIDTGEIALIEGSQEESDGLDFQLAQATLLLHQNTNFLVPSNLDHLSELQRTLYCRLLSEQHPTTDEVD